MTLTLTLLSRLRSPIFLSNCFLISLAVMEYSFIFIYLLLFFSCSRGQKQPLFILFRVGLPTCVSSKNSFSFLSSTLHSINLCLSIHFFVGFYLCTNASPNIYIKKISPDLEFLSLISQFPYSHHQTFDMLEFNICTW